MTKKIYENTVLIGKRDTFGSSSASPLVFINFIIFEDLSSRSSRHKLKIYGDIPSLQGINTFEQIYEGFVNYPENLYISKSEFTKLMDIWGDLESVYVPKETVASRNEFIKSLKTKDEYLHVHKNYDIQKLEDELEKAKTSYSQMLEDSQAHAGP